MSKNWTWYRPASLEEATALLLERGADSFIVAGATSLALNPPRRDGLAMVDLQALGLETVTELGDRLRLGAMVTAQQLTRDERCREIATGVLCEVGMAMGPRPVRNKITVGGNVMQVFRWCDLPVALLALDAAFEISGPRGVKRELSAVELFDGQPRRKLEEGELLTAVILERSSKNLSGAFLKVAQTEVDHALVNVAVTLELDGDRCQWARVAVGAVRTLPQRLDEVERACAGRGLDAATLAEVSELARGCDVKADRRGDEQYRRDVAVALVRRALEKALARSRAGVDGGVQ
jgi:aerobic carbon-monoxide dehydrogenase medium subunit